MLVTCPSFGISNPIINRAILLQFVQGPPRVLAVNPTSNYLLSCQPGLVANQLRRLLIEPLLKHARDIGQHIKTDYSSLNNRKFFTTVYNPL